MNRETPSHTHPDPAAGSSVFVSVNGRSLEVAASCSIAGLLEKLELTRRRLAVAVNREVVPRSTYATAQLSAGDCIEILEAVGGG